MQVRRAVAIATGVILLAVGFLAQHHEAAAAHVRERSGRVVHAQELADHHEVSTNAHLHGRALHDDTSDCSLLALAHERVVHTPRAVHATPAVAAERVAIVLVTHSHAAIAAYRLAPKTSPPSA